MPASPSTSRLRVSPGLWLFLLTFAIRLLVLTRFSDSLHFLPDGDDMKFYSDWAMRIRGGLWTDHQAFYGLPGYAYILAAIFFLVGYDPFTVGLLQAAIDAGTAILIWKICFLIFAPGEAELRTRSTTLRANVIGIGAALAWACFTPAQAFSIVTMPTAWLVCAYYLCLWFALRTRKSTWWSPWLGLGLLIGAVSMLVATILFAIPFLLVTLVRSVERGNPHRLAKIAAALAVFIASIYAGASPAWIHNYFIAHEPVMLSAHSGINFWIGNNPTSTGYPKMPPGIRATQEGALRDSITLAEEATGHPMTHAEVSKYWSAKANAYIAGNFPAWVRLVGVKLGNFWNAYQYDDLSIIKLLRDDGVLPPGLRFGFVAALGLAGLLPAFLRFPRSRWVVATVVLHMCALIPAFVTERYRLAAAPGLMILGAAGLWIFWDNLSHRRWGWVATYIALGAMAAWFVSIPRSDTSLWSLDQYKAGIRATAAGQIELARGNHPGADAAFARAQRNLETAYAYVSTNADIDFALGNLALARSQQHATDRRVAAEELAQAKHYYRLAFELNPRHAGTLNNLGVLAMEEKRWPLAEKFLGAAIEAEPTDAKTRYLLARVLFEQGKLDPARTEIGIALRARPNQKEFLELQEKLQARPK